MKMKHRLLVETIVLAAMLTVGLTAGGPSFAANGPPSRTSALAYHDLWIELWEDHITWTRMVIIGSLDDLPGNDAYKTRLLQNYEDMEEALAPYFGEDAEELGDLILDHLLIAVEILDAAEAGNTAALEDATARWYANGHDIAALMAEMNPTFWPLSMGDPMWSDHLDATLEEAVAHLTGDFAGDVEAYDRVHELALEMADFFSSGVIQQFGSSFSHAQCVLDRGTGPDAGEAGAGEDEVKSKILSFAVDAGPGIGPHAIRLALAQGGPVSLAVYNVNGRRVAQVFEGVLEAGPHTLTWTGLVEGGFAPARGIYFARLTAGPEIRVTKLFDLRR